MSLGFKGDKFITWIKELQMPKTDLKHYFEQASVKMALKTFKLTSVYFKLSDCIKNNHQTWKINQWIKAYNIEF